jgi:hypothetical protein
MKSDKEKCQMKNEKRECKFPSQSGLCCWIWEESIILERSHQHMTLRTKIIGFELGKFVSGL